MGSTLRIRAKLLARLLAPIVFATALSACSTVPDWVDPTTWVGGDSQVSSDQSSDAGAGTDQSAPAAQEAASTKPSGDGQTPDIAAIPARPTPPSTADEQKQVADSLAADRAQAHYSADALRGGTEATAAPPPAEGAAPQVSGNSAASATPASGAANQAADAEASSAADNQTASNPLAPPADATAPSASAGEGRAAGAQTPAAAPVTTSSAAPAPGQVASTDAASTSAPAAAPIAAETGAPARAAPDMQATFAPSKAPALDPSVGQFVPQQILSRYQETAAGASVPTESSSATSAKHHRRKKIKSSQSVIRLHYVSRLRTERTAMISPSYSPSRRSTMPRGAALTRSSSSLHGLDPALFAPANKVALAVVDFTRETTILDSAARNRIQSAARNFVAQGGAGFMRVVGHASDRAGNLPRAMRLRNNFERSEAQATAVARELIRDGVPVQRVLVEADGDRSAGGGHLMARASRNAEIFFQS
jgi:hypothetical protein